MISLYTGISQINSLYRKLADLETNIYKRFVVVTSMTRHIFSNGLHPIEQKLFSESLRKLKHHEKGQPLFKVVLRSIDDYLNNICDLSYLIQSYKKPLLAYANGVTGGYGSCLISLANTSACYKHSKFKFNNIDNGVPLLGGQSYLLAMLRGSLGEYLLLTGKVLSGEDLVWSGLVRRFIPPDAIGLIQLTAERLVELPEKETEIQLQELYSPIETPYSLERFEWLIHEHFNRPSVKDILHSLERGISEKKLRSQSNLKSDVVRNWEMETMDIIMDRKSSELMDLDTSLKLIRDVKAYKVEVLKSLDITPKRWEEIKRFIYKPPLEKNDMYAFELLRNVQCEVLLESLQLELESFFTMLGKSLGLPDYNIWPESRFSVHPFTPSYRSGVALSSLPYLRKLHPDYDANTDSDHDAIRTDRLHERWPPDFLQREMMLMKRILIK
uniref:Enoyl-CoA hydratase/isomerase domain-containing protein n=1 Tax=Babesia bovis TaxID=5865 RepID=A7ARF0_BABBO|eukprot:XP_001610687.1 hypothetical protein [Babesia bovis T2Bo]